MTPKTQIGSTRLTMRYLTQTAALRTCPTCGRNGLTFRLPRNTKRETYGTVHCMSYNNGCGFKGEY